MYQSLKKAAGKQLKCWFQIRKASEGLELCRSKKSKQLHLVSHTATTFWILQSELRKGSGFTEYRHCCAIDPWSWVYRVKALLCDLPRVWIKAS